MPGPRPTPRPQLRSDVCVDRDAGLAIVTRCQVTKEIWGLRTGKPAERGEEQGTCASLVRHLNSKSKPERDHFVDCYGVPNGKLALLGGAAVVLAVGGLFWWLK